jgi:hypothetical protein
MSNYENNLARIKQERLSLRNRRIKMLKPQQILQDLIMEREQVESEIKKLQERFYRDKKISENEYKIEFKVLNERLAEIEGERITLELLKEKKHKKIKSKDVKEEVAESIAESKREIDESNRIRIILLKIAGFFKRLKGKIKKNDKKGIVLINSKVMEILKKEASKRKSKR